MANFTTSDGLSLYYDDQGTGTPVLCLAGLTRDARDFDYVLPVLLEAGCRVIRLDYRGRGQSDWAEDFMQYNLVREGQDAVELLDHLGIEQTAILGTSRGGLIAMGLATTIKDRLLGVALNDIGPEMDPKGLSAIMTYLGKKPTAKTLGEAAAALEYIMSAGFPGVPKSRWDQEAAKLFVQTEDGLDLPYDPKLRDATAAMGETAMPDLWPYYMALDGLPVCVIRGANSDLLTQKCFEQMRDRMPTAQGVVVADRAHIPYLDESEATQALRQWIGRMQ